MTATPSLIMAWVFYGFMSVFPFIYLNLQDKKVNSDKREEKND